MEEGLRFGVFGPLRLFHDLAEASQQGRGSVRVAELVLDQREEGQSAVWLLIAGARKCGTHCRTWADNG